MSDSNPNSSHPLRTIQTDQGSRNMTNAPKNNINPDLVRYRIDRVIPEQGTRNTAINRAWFEEAKLVKQTSQGSVNWSVAEKRVLIKAGSAPNQSAALRILKSENIGTASKPVTLTRLYHGHHINSVKSFPHLRGDSRNIMFVTKKQHVDAHRVFGQNVNKSFSQIPTRGRVIDRVRTIQQNNVNRNSQRKIKLINRRARVKKDVVGNFKINSIEEIEMNGLKKCAGKVLKGVKIMSLAQTTNTMINGSNRDRFVSACEIVGGFVGGVFGSLGGLMGFFGGVAGSYIAGNVAEKVWDYFEKPNEEDKNPGILPETSIGGVSLSTRELEFPKFSLNSEISGIRVINGSLEFLGNNSTKMNILVTEEDLLATILSIYEYNTQPSFSLDPFDKNNVDGKWYKKVYYPEVFQNTKFGDTLFTTDFLMKQYGMGVTCTDDQGGVIQKIGRIIPELKTQSELYFEKYKNKENGSIRNRLWIEIDKIEVKKEKDGIVFGDVKMKVLTKKQIIDPNSKTGLSDVSDNSDNFCSEFSKLFSLHYDKIAQKIPEFQRLKELSKLVYIISWMKENGIKVNNEVIKEDLERIKSKRTQHKDKIHKLSTQYKERNVVLTLSGGISLNLKDNLKIKNYQKKSEVQMNKMNSKVQKKIDLKYFDKDNQNLVIIKKLIEEDKFKDALGEIEANLIYEVFSIPDLFEQKVTVLEKLNYPKKDILLNQYYNSYSRLISSDGGRRKDVDLLERSTKRIGEIYKEEVKNGTDFSFGEIKIKIPNNFQVLKIEKKPNFTGFVDYSARSYNFYNDCLSFQIFKNAGFKEYEEKVCKNYSYFGNKNGKEISDNIKYYTYEEKFDDGYNGLFYHEIRVLSKSKLFYVITGITIYERKDLFSIFFQEMLKTFRLYSSVNTQKNNDTMRGIAILQECFDYFQKQEESDLEKAIKISEMEYFKKKEEEKNRELYLERLRKQEDEELQKAIQLSIENNEEKKREKSRKEKEELERAISLSLENNFKNENDIELMKAIHESQKTLKMEKRKESNDKELLLAIKESLKTSEEESHKQEMKMLEELGFTNKKTNMTILKLVNFNVMKAVELLIN